MQRYDIIQTLGEHAYGLIMKAQNKETYEKVIIKMHKKKFYTWEECMLIKEIKVLRIVNHSGIQKLKELIREKDTLYSVYEWCDESLFEFYQELRDKGQIIQETEIKAIMHQIISTLHYIHKIGFIHRDLCLENVFINDGRIIKVGNFYTARESNAKPPLTDYITTRWYRAPEQLLHSQTYNYKIDMWAIGCMMAELYLLGPFFGGSSESDQLFRIVKTLGTPKDWAEYYSLINNMKIQLPEFPPKQLSNLIPNASKEAIDLIQKLLTFNPQKRYNCAQCLKHPFFTGQQINSNLNSPKPFKQQPQNQYLSNFQLEAQQKEKLEKSKNQSISEEESLQSSPKSQKSVPQQILEMNFESIRPTSKDCNREDKAMAEQIKQAKELEGGKQIQKQLERIKDEEIKDSEDSEDQDSFQIDQKYDIQDVKAQIRKSTGAVFTMPHTMLQNPMAQKDIETMIPGVNFMFKRNSLNLGQGGKILGQLSSNLPTIKDEIEKKDNSEDKKQNDEEQKQINLQDRQEPVPKTPDQPPGLNLDGIIKKII